MDIITTHTNADFDAISSIVAANKLYPSAKGVLSGSVEEDVKRFLKDFPCGILRSKNINKGEIMLLSSLFKNLKIYKINNVDIAFTWVKEDKYVGDLAILAHKMMDIEPFLCLFLIIKIKDHIHIIARSRIKEVDVSSILSDFGGGGHREAASCTLKGRPIYCIKRMLISRIKTKRRNLLFLMEARLHSEIKEIIEISSTLADEMGVSCYVVGGFVRDLIMGLPLKSLDILIVGDGLLFAKRLSSMLSLNCIFHKRFKTASMLRNGIKIDIATSRLEIYKHPGSLPQVKGANLKKDLSRRDFTINTLAIPLNKKRKGFLVDLYQGCEDIKNKKIRILHHNSFIDDPTRVFRAVRFESRLGFKMDEETEALARHAIENGYLSYVSKTRIRNELLLILSDERPQKAFLRLSKLGVLRFIYPGLCPDCKMFLKVGEAMLLASIVYNEIDVSLLNLLVLVDKLNGDELKAFLTMLRFPRKIRNDVLKIKENKGLILFLRRKGLKNSIIYERLNKIPKEGLIFIMAKTKSKEVKREILKFFTLKKEPIFTTGDDLKRLGFKPGPIYKKILKELFLLKLDGKIKTKEDELKFIDKF